MQIVVTDFVKQLYYNALYLSCLWRDVRAWSRCSSTQAHLNPSVDNSRDKSEKTCIGRTWSPLALESIAYSCHTILSNKNNKNFCHNHQKWEIFFPNILRWQLLFQLCGNRNERPTKRGHDEQASTREKERAPPLHPQTLDPRPCIKSPGKLPFLKIFRMKSYRIV